MTAEPATAPTIRILLADDDALVRAGMRMILGTVPDFEVVGEAADGAEAVALAAALHPDVVVMDIRMPEMDGIEATREIVGRDPVPGPDDGGDAGGATRVLVVTTFELDEYVYEAVRAGASGFLLKRSPPEEVIAGIRAVAGGDSLLSPSVTRKLLAAFAQASVGGSPRADVTIDSLTAREHDVLVLVANGLSNREIADELIIGEATVKTHVKRILMKLHLRDRVHAVVYAYQIGLVRP